MISDGIGVVWKVWQDLQMSSMMLPSLAAMNRPFVPPKVLARFLSSPCLRRNLQWVEISRTGSKEPAAISRAAGVSQP